MSPTTAPPSPSRFLNPAAWAPSLRALLWVLGAFLAGLLLFLLVWRNNGDSDFYRAGPAAPTAAEPKYAPLPAPIADGDGDVSDIEPSARRSGDAERPRLVETTPPPIPQVARAPAPRAAPQAAIAQPQPISSPAPHYPAAALRRGEQGTVLVSAQIGADGVPTAVAVDRSSGSRLLDRAAVDAVRRWRFRPATANGQPTPAQVQIPISFQN